MNNHVVILAAAALALIGSAAGQASEIPRMPDGKPNFNGIWDHPYVPDVSKDGKDQKGAGALPFTPAGADNFKNYDVSKFDYTGPLPALRVDAFHECGRVSDSGHAVRQITSRLLFEQSNWFHVVAMARDHPKPLDPTWFGDSVGKWDGDTLVIDTIGFNGKTRLDTVGHPHSDQMHIVERLQADRRRSHRVRSHGRRSEDVLEALEERADLLAHEARPGTD